MHTAQPPNLPRPSPAHPRFYAIIVLLNAIMAQANAAPQGSSVVGGDGTISQQAGATIINQVSERLAIDWQSFDIGTDERVQFIQPANTSIALNRILSNDASQILGRLEANGRIILANPQGVVFGDGAQVHVGSVIAAGLDINPQDFINGELAFQSDSHSKGLVINSGLIEAATGGSVALLGQSVANQGLISAALGSVTLAAGRSAVLTFDAQGMLGVRVTEEALQRRPGLDAVVTNSGEITAPRGRVLLTASVSEDLFSRAVNSGDLGRIREVLLHDDNSFSLGAGAKLDNSGSITVSSEDSDRNQRAGTVILLGDEIRHTGTIRADSHAGAAGEVVIASSKHVWLQHDGLASANVSSPADGTDGQVTLLGKHLYLTDSALIQTLGGGSILLGSEDQGATSLPTTEFLLLDRDAGLSTAGGQGGSISARARLAMMVAGSLDVTAPSTGGRLELASSGLLGLSGWVNLTGDDAGGQLSVTAQDLRINSSEASFNLHPQALNSALTGGSVSLTAHNSLELGETGRGVQLVSQGVAGERSLALAAGGNLNLHDSVIRVPGKLTLTAGLAAHGSNAATLDIRNSSLSSADAISLHSGGDIYALNTSLLQAAVTASADGSIHLPLSASVQWASLVAGGDLRTSTAAEGHRPTLHLSGHNIEVFSPSGFEGEINAQNLVLESRQADLGGVVAQLQVEGTTHLKNGGTFDLSGDLNLLTAEAHDHAVHLNVTTKGDLRLGNMLFSESTVSLRSLSDRARISQEQHSLINIGVGSLALAADNLDLGAQGSARVRIYSGQLGLQFNQTLTLNTDLKDFSNPATARLQITGSKANSQITIGEFFNLPEHSGESPQHTINFGGGDDTINLFAALRVPFYLGDGADTIVIHRPDITYTAADFNPETDRVIEYPP